MMSVSPASCEVTSTLDSLVPNRRSIRDRSVSESWLHDCFDVTPGSMALHVQRQKSESSQARLTGQQAMS